MSGSPNQDWDFVPMSFEDLHTLISESPLSANAKASYAASCENLINSLEKADTTSLSKILSSIPETPVPTCLPIACLSVLLATYPGQWPVFDLIQCLCNVWKAMPEAGKSGHNEKMASIAATVERQVKSSYKGLPDLFIKDSDKDAFIDPANSKTLTHRALSKFIDNFSLPVPVTEGPKPIVVVALPNGPLLALACMAVSSYYTAAPINSTAGAGQFESDVLQTGSKTILASRSDIKRLALDGPWISAHHIDVLLVDQNEHMTFNLTELNPLKHNQSDPVPANRPDDIAFILFTSGTSGTKKVVPLTMHSIVSGVAFVMESWGLTENDSCLNMMPLNHVGGLVRNLFAPVLAGGSTILCPAFDPNLFWDIVEERDPTWYYASPSMHSTILSETPNRTEALARSQIRLVCNAAGGLLPSLAIQIRDTFNCIVLPSYGMTECMPISTPPLDYKLERSGTSGVSVGPEIAILDGNDNASPDGVVGRIHVRGSPVFPGYLKPTGEYDTTPFNSNGWFDTGDMGYLDQDGYLYITGRSKEVINRGGELISPFEVEEAIMIAAQDPHSPIFERVSETLVFSAPHDVLQEVVGVVLVTPPGKPRADLRELHEATKSSLHSVKWPFVVVYMDGLPKGNNKILRVKLGERLDFEPVSDDMTLGSRHFEAKCPPVNSPLTLKIGKQPCTIDVDAVLAVVKSELGDTLDGYVCRSRVDDLPEVVLAPKSDGVSFTIPDFVIQNLKSNMKEQLDGYLVPTHVKIIEEPLPTRADGTVDEERLDEIVKAANKDEVPEGVSGPERKLREIFADLLACTQGDLAAESDFFEMGGDSLKAGRLLSLIRKEFQVRLPIGDLFTNSSLLSLTTLVEQNMPNKSEMEEMKNMAQVPLPGCEKTYSSTNPFLLILQLVPIGLLYPMRRALSWTILLFALSSMLKVFPGQTKIYDRFIFLVISIWIAAIATSIIAPLFAIACKWLIIGRYREGLYPMWGPYHTRWWFVEKCLTVGGKGIFNHFNWTRVLYYRLLGARISYRVSIDKGTLMGEFDLIEIDSDVTLDRCVIRPFGVERNTSMYLGKIQIGARSSIGLKSFVAPGTFMPADTCIGPNSSSWEMQDATEANRDLSVSKVPKPHFLWNIFTVPTVLAVRFVAMVPWMAGLVGLVVQEPAASKSMARSVIMWFASPTRVGYHYLARVMGATVGVVVYFVLAVAIKRALDFAFGKIKTGPNRGRSQLQKFRQNLMATLLPGGDLSKFTEHFGSHYESTSMAVRALGGKVGRRVYWPGSGPSVQDFDFIDIGDNVVFGSRSHIVTSDGTGSEIVKIGANCMVADRCVLLPGASLGDRVVLGSGALAKRNTHYAKDTVWVGNKGGGAICLTAPDGMQTPSSYNSYSDDEIMKEKQSNDSMSTICDSCGNKACASIRERRVQEDSSVDEESALNPFGRAFYEGNASYYVLGVFAIFCYSTFTNIFISVYWNVATVSGVQLMAWIIDLAPHAYEHGWWEPLAIYATMCLAVAIILNAQAIIAIGIIICSKWALMGRRKAGNYDWDKSSYCQRWQVLLTIERLRRNCYGKAGIIGMLTGTHYAVMYMRALGATIGKDCALFAGGKPSLLFTEPDLLTLGDRVAVDDASLVAHINSRGKFDLNPLNVGSRSALRTGSRLLSGATMGEDSCLLEHTLVMSGDIVDAGTTYQGWPAEEFNGARVGNVRVH